MRHNVFFYFCAFLEGMNARARLSSAKSKLDRASTSMKRTLEESLSVEIASPESPCKKLNSAEERLFKRYVPTTTFAILYGAKNV